MSKTFDNNYIFVARIRKHMVHFLILSFSLRLARLSKDQKAILQFLDFHAVNDFSLFRRIPFACYRQITSVC